jgi:hypothetical protein
MSFQGGYHTPLNQQPRGAMTDTIKTDERAEIVIKRYLCRHIHT